MAGLDPQQFAVATEEGSHFAVIALGVALDRVRTRRRLLAPAGA